MGSRRVGLPWACEPTARRVRSEGYPCSLHQSRNAPSKCFERRAPRSVPNTAPDPPLPPGLGYHSGARRHTEPRSRSSSWTVGECGVQKTPTPEWPSSRGIPVVVPIACESLMAAIMLPSGYCRKADRSATGSACCGGGIRSAPESSGRGRRPAGSAPHPG
ncbi:unnamed protein product [Rangifer tarandus platyrhynchus]|uniref:Uncharacterized protein n=1 Tax=Rangifer tarandus platyrhynchus TaxID=3082113 RepID=A0AC60A3E8_RANTA